MRGRSLALVAVLSLAGRLDAAPGGNSSWVPLPQPSPQQQTHLLNGLTQAASDIAGKFGGIVAGGTTSVFTALAGYTSTASALWERDYDLAREEFLTATLNNIAVSTGALGGMILAPALGPLAPAAPFVGAIFGGWVYQELGIESAIRGAFERRADIRGSETAAERLRLRDRLPPVRDACGRAAGLVAGARELIEASGGSGPPVDDLYGEAGELEAAVGALGGRIEDSGLRGAHGGAGDEQAIVGELADLDWIAVEACRIASQAAATDVEGARKVWQSEGRFLGERIAARHAAVLSRIDGAEASLRSAAAERAAQRAEVQRLTAAVDALAARIRSARESAAGAFGPFDRAAQLLEEAGAALAECVRQYESLKGAVERIIGLSDGPEPPELAALRAELAAIPVPSGEHRLALEDLALRRTSLQRSVSYLDGLAATTQHFRSSLDRWRGLLSSANASGDSPAKARSEADVHRRKAESCRTRAEMLASAGAAGTDAGLVTTSEADCERKWPGTVLRSDPATGRTSCQCPLGSAWSKVSGACLALPAGIAGTLAGGDCRHKPGTMRDSRTGECECPIGEWDTWAKRCVDTAAAARAQDVAAKQAAADCENLYSRMRVFRLSTDGVGQAAAAEAERGAHARGCDVTRIAEAKGPPPPPPPPVGGGTGSGPPAGGGSGTGGGGRTPATCRVFEQGGEGGVTLVYEQTALGNHFNVYVVAAPKKDLAAVEAHYGGQAGFRLVGRFGSYSQGVTVAQNTCAKRTAATSTAEPEEGLCNCVDERGRRYTEAFGQPCGTGGQAIRDYNCPSR